MFSKNAADYDANIHDAFSHLCILDDSTGAPGKEKLWLKDTTLVFGFILYYMADKVVAPILPRWLICPSSIPLWERRQKSLLSFAVPVWVFKMIDWLLFLPWQLCWRWSCTFPYRFTELEDTQSKYEKHFLFNKKIIHLVDYILWHQGFTNAELAEKIWSHYLTNWHKSAQQWFQNSWTEKRGLIAAAEFCDLDDYHTPLKDGCCKLAMACISISWWLEEVCSGSCPGQN